MTPMTALDGLLIAVAGFLAGGINAVAGGGSLISFPALIATGLPTLTANVTNTVAIWPGYLGSTAAYRVELAEQRRRVLRLGLTGVAGATVGSIILLVADDAVFDAIVPVLILGACALLALQPRIATAVAARVAQPEPGGTDAPPRQLGLHAATFAAAAYGAYFGGGLGVILLAVLGIFIADSLQHTNALKTALSLIINTVALVIFALFAPVDWTSAAIVAPASLLGGYVGGRFARRLPPTVLRTTVIAFGVVVAVVLILT